MAPISSLRVALLALAGTFAATTARAQSTVRSTSAASGPATGAPASATISNGSFDVTVNAYGVVTNVSTAGWIPTFGPRVEIVPDDGSSAVPGGGPSGPGAPGITEWQGLSFETPNGDVAVSACGRQADWTTRVPLAVVDFTATADRAVSVTRAAGVELRTTISFAPQSGWVVVQVDVTNVGAVAIRDVLWSREWSTRDSKATSFPPEEALEVGPAPAGIHRLLLDVSDLQPGMRAGTTLALEPMGSLRSPAAVDVPLSLWVNGTWPSGLDFGSTNGIAFGDADHDGSIDVFTCMGRQLWRNLGGVDWKRVGNLSSLIGAGELNYNGVFGDYNEDQLADLVTSPRGGCSHVLKNLTGRQFMEVATDPAIVDVQPCNAYAETDIAWDSDGDGLLDFFVPAYLQVGGGGNWFLQNLGPVGAGGEYTFHEASATVGLDNPPGVGVPEGAGIADVDEDGDSDLYCNGTLYRNVSVPGAPLFVAMGETGSGITHSSVPDEGAGFFDYDLDGDLDLCVAFCDSNLGVRMFEALGDGTFTLTKRGIFDSYNTGLCLGLSFDDWDNDGDVDVTTSEVFRRNQFVETGVRHFTVATHSINASDITDATPAWGDFDLDGDLDSALGNWFSTGHLYENTLYDASTPSDQRRYVRVKPVRDSANFDDGLETEYGATISVHPLGNADDGLARRKICAPSNGYLNQGEYTVHFALPPDPDPSDPRVDLAFEVAVDFKGARGQGFPRVDRHVNPVLGAIRLASLSNREILVFRSGRVRIDGADYFPTNAAPPLTTTTGGLVAPGVNTAIPAIAGAPASDWFVGTEISTAAAAAPQRIEELILDGQLDAAVACGGASGNVFVWDVTTPGSPVLASGGLVLRSTSSRNDRSFLPLDATLAPNRTYRIVARVTQLRASPVAAPVVDGPFTTNGGLSFQDATPCSGAGTAAATVDAGNVYLAVRFRDEPSSAWGDLGNGLAGVSGIPALVGSGNLVAGANTSLDVNGAAANAGVFWVLGTASDSLHFAGGVLVPTLDVIVSGLATDGAGHAALGGAWPAGLPGGFSFYAQALVLDVAAPRGLAFSNAVVGTTPY